MHESIFIKRTAKILITAIGILLIAVICTALVHYSKLVDINNYNDVAAAISENSLVENTDHFEI